MTYGACLAVQIMVLRNLKSPTILSMKSANFNAKKHSNITQNYG